MIRPDEEPVSVYSAHSLRADLDSLAAALRALGPRAAALDGRLADAETTLARLDRRCQETELQQRSMASQVRRLAVRVEWLERSTRRRGDPELQLDDVPPDLRQLARLAEEGHQAAEALLPDEARVRLEGVVQAHTQVVHALVGHRREAVVQAQELASTGWRDAAHRAAAARFGDEVTRYRALREEVARLAGPALEARRDLEADDAARAASSGAIEAGRRAAEQLRQQLRTRLDDALAAGALLPQWFVADLGPLPPPTAEEQWLAAAVDLVAYRVTFAVTDAESALGDAPTPTDGPRRQDWHRRLGRQLQMVAQ